MMLLVIVGEERILEIPPPEEAELSVIVQLMILGLVEKKKGGIYGLKAPKQKIPPPFSSALLPLMIQLVIIGEHVSQKIPPP